MCRVLGARLPSVNNFRRVILGYGGRFSTDTPYNARDLGYPYTSCLKRLCISYIGDPYYWTSNRGSKIMGYIVNTAYGNFHQSPYSNTDAFVGCIRYYR